MKKSILILSSAIIICSVFLWCSPAKKTPILENTNEPKIPIVATDELIWIHARMIAKNRAFVVTIDTDTTITKKEKEILHDSSMIISDIELAKSSFDKILKKYEWRYIDIGTRAINQQPTKLEETIIEIEKIRDAFVNLDPKNKWMYYDSAGSYIHTLRETYKRLEQRLSEYNKKAYILVGYEPSIFLEDFWLSQYKKWHIKTYKDTSDLINQINTLREKNTVDIIISDEILPKQIKNLGMFIYYFPELEDDVSGWGYIRFIQKMVSTFVSAYDTYD